MYLEVRAAVTGHGRAHPDVADTRPGLAVDLDAGQVHPGQRHAAPLELDVGGGRAELAGQLLAVQHAPGDAIRAAQQVLGELEVAFAQRLAHLGAADPQAILDHRVGSLDGEPVLLAGTDQEGEVAGPVAAEAKVIAHLEVAHAQAVDQDRLDEFIGAELAQALVEGQAQHPVDAFCGQQLDLVAQARQAGRGGVGRKVLARLWLEDHHAGRQAQRLAALAQARQDCLVATVNPVEVANGGDTAPVLGAQVVKTSNQLHNALLAHKVADYNHTRALVTGSSARVWRGMRKTDA